MQRKTVAGSNGSRGSQHHFLQHHQSQQPTRDDQRKQQGGVSWFLVVASFAAILVVLMLMSVQLQLMRQVGTQGVNHGMQEIHQQESPKVSAGTAASKQAPVQDTRKGDTTTVAVTTTETTAAVVKEDTASKGTDEDGDQHNAFRDIIKRKEMKMKQDLESPTHNDQTNAKQNGVIAGNNTVPEDLSKTIAYAISLIKCGDHQSTPTGLVDAAMVLRHSVHMTSSRNPESGSKYDYHMVAIVHRQALECAGTLKTVGFEIMVVDTPINPRHIRGNFLRKKIHKEWCCGADEFIKWYPFKMTKYPAVVHLDIDFAFKEPMDELFDAMLYPKDSPEGQAARALIPLERPAEGMPDKIDAFITRDWPQVRPGRNPGFQAGFMLVRPDPTVFDELKEIVLEGNFVDDYSHQNGWGAKGYGTFVGAMAMQGLMAYYWDVIRPNTAVELNQCRYNWMGMDVLYRAPPNFVRNHHRYGLCRNDLDYCEDCTNTSSSLIKSVHYTQCRKPWNCIGRGGRGREDKGAIDVTSGNFEKCIEMVRMWHSYRTDLETKLYAITKDESIRLAATSDYKRDVFQGHCLGEGGDNYLQINATASSFARLHEIYEL